jgi:hypothetical protein
VKLRPSHAEDGCGVVRRGVSEEARREPVDRAYGLVLSNPGGRHERQAAHRESRCHTEREPQGPDERPAAHAGAPFLLGRGAEARHRVGGPLSRAGAPDSPCLGAGFVVFRLMAAAPELKVVDEGTNLTGLQLVAIMAATLGAALVFLYVVSG